MVEEHLVPPMRLNIINCKFNEDKAANLITASFLSDPLKRNYLQVYQKRFKTLKR
jgi:hypothetical protein